MATAAKKKKGTARMRQLGRTSVIVWLAPLEALDLDAVRGNLPRATWAYATLTHAIRQALAHKKAS
jgi:hypothetical protein